MNNTQLLKEIFDLAKQGKPVDITNLPSDISREVVEKNLLYIELKRLVTNNGNPARIEEIKAILNPPQEETSEDLVL
jgi:hypothetical protein